ILAILPILPAHAALGTVTLSSDKFSKNMLLQVTVTDPDIVDSDPGAQLASVRVEYTDTGGTFRKKDLKMAEAVGGQWICWIKVSGGTTDKPENPPSTWYAPGTYPDDYVNELPAEPKSGGKVKVIYTDTSENVEVTVEATYTTTEASISLDRATYPLNAKIHITVTDPDENKDPTKVEEITNTRIKVQLKGGSYNYDWEGNPTSIKETGPNTGEFKAVFDLGTAPEDMNYDIKVVYTDESDDKDVSKHALVTASTAEISLDKDTYMVNDTATVTLIEPDLNLDSASKESYTDKVYVYSDVDGAKKSVKIEETGANTGIFTGSFKFKIGGSSSDGDKPTIAALADKKVYVEYKDELLATGEKNKIRSDSATFKTHTGVLETDRDSYAPGMFVTVTVTDPDLNLDPYTKEELQVEQVGEKYALKVSGVSIKSDYTELPIKIYSTDWDGDVVSPLTETDVNTGVFETTYNIKDKVKAGETLYFRYIDPANSAGTTQTIEASASLDTTTGTLELDKTVYKPNEKIKITVVDPDWNVNPKDKDSIPSTKVNVKSDTTPGGVNKELKETDKDTDTFTGEVKIYVEGGSGDLLVKRGDTITVTYTDDYTSGGGGTIKVTKTAKVYSSDGSISLDKAVYSPRAKVKITVTDPDMNVDSGAINTITDKVRAYTTSDPSGITIDVTETDVDTGVFIAVIKLADTTSGTNLKASRGDGLTVVYTEEADAAGNKDVARRTSASISYQTATMTFDKNIYLMTDTATITLNEPDLNLDPSLKESVTVTVTSTSDSAGIRVTLVETDVDTGIFNGTFTFTSGTSIGTMLQAKKGDTIKAVYRDESPSEYPTPESVLVTAEATIGVKFVEKPITAETPTLKDTTTCETLTKGEVGKTVMLSTEMENTAEEDQE
ncbi:MAG: hypothetical protein DRG31_07530, partial [Deltaproteobacteria bacterium]